VSLPYFIIKIPIVLLFMLHKLPRILHIISRKCWYSVEINVLWWVIP